MRLDPLRFGPEDISPWSAAAAAACSDLGVPVHPDLNAPDAANSIVSRFRSQTPSGQRELRPEKIADSLGD